MGSADGLVVVNNSPSGWRDLSESSQVAALAVESGDLRWLRKGYAATAVTSGVALASIASPRDNQAYYGIGVAGLNLADGRPVWTHDDEDFVGFTPVAASPEYVVTTTPNARGLLLAAARAGEVVCWDRDLGRLKVIDLTSGAQSNHEARGQDRLTGLLAGGACLPDVDNQSVFVDAQGVARPTDVPCPDLLAAAGEYAVLATIPGNAEAPDGPVRIVSVKP